MIMNNDIKKIFVVVDDDNYLNSKLKQSAYGLEILKSIRTKLPEM
ncbi:MAG: hypothetical protein ACI857_000310 [Arenicella sp.]|jgi:hypothetical protein